MYGRIATGDPAHVPVGRYAQQALTKLGLWNMAKSRLAPSDSVRSAQLLVERGEAPVGIVYATDAAIGRALLSQPRLLAMDEPLASLDGKRKAEILPFLIRLKTSLALPILYVTHSQEELASLADTLVLIDAGRVIAAGPVDEIVSRGDLPTAKRDDAGAVLAVRVAKHDVTLGLTTIDCNDTHFVVPLLDAAPETRMRVRVPAREVILATERPGASSVHNVLEGQVRQITPDPEHRAVMVEVQLLGTRLLARITPDAVDRLHLANGVSVLALVKSVSIEILPS